MHYLHNINKTDEEKYIFIEKMYKLANVSFSEYVKQKP